MTFFCDSLVFKRFAATNVHWIFVAIFIQLTTVRKIKWRTFKSLRDAFPIFTHMIIFHFWLRIDNIQVTYTKRWNLSTLLSRCTHIQYLQHREHLLDRSIEFVLHCGNIQYLCNTEHMLDQSKEEKGFSYSFTSGMPPLPQVFSSSTTVLLDKVLPYSLVDLLGFEDQFQT